MYNILDVGQIIGIPTESMFTLWSHERKAQVFGDLSDYGDLRGFDLIAFGGGEDIHPKLYNHSNVASRVGHDLSRRDIIERAIFTEAVKAGVPMVGICRGAQLVCALSGGSLIQDVTAHGMTHELIVPDRTEPLMISSAHHQMMYPYAIQHEVLGWCRPRSKHYESDIRNFIVPESEPEVVFFPQTKSLGIQGHPEFMRFDHPTVQYLLNLIERKLLNVVH